MTRYVGARLLWACIIVIGIVAVNFVLTHIIPGNPVNAIVGDFPVPQAFREAIEKKYRLNDPLPVRIGTYFGNLLHGDLGYSYHAQRPVLDMILERAPRTILLAAAGFGVALRSASVTILLPMACFSGRSGKNRDFRPRRQHGLFAGDSGSAQARGFGTAPSLQACPISPAKTAQARRQRRGPWTTHGDHARAARNRVQRLR